jgi:MSHA pilin protein MshD
MSMNKQMQRGFTLIELIIFIVVVGASMAGILSVMTTTVKSSADPMVRKQTIAIAESMLEEILLKDYAKPTGSLVQGYSTGGTRDQFDCIDDYNGYTTGSSGIPDIHAAPPAVIAGLLNYNVTSVVVGTPAPLGSSLPAKLVTVSVTGPSGAISLSGYRTCDLSPSCPLP